MFVWAVHCDCWSIHSNAPFTPGGDCRASGRNSANRHWSLVVVPSQLLVANVWRTVSKRHWNEKIIFISATKWTVVRLSRIVETQSWWSRTTNMQKKIKAAWRNITTLPQLCLNYHPTAGRQMETITAKWWALETTGQQITLPQKLKHIFYFCVGKQWNLLNMCQVNRVDRLTPLICKLDTNYHKALDPGLKVAIALCYMATGDSSKSLQYGFHVAYNSICLLIV